MPYRDRDAESFFAQAAKDSKIQELPPIPNSLLRRDPDPPTEGYLQARADLGHPSRSAYIVVACPWCGAWHPPAVHQRRHRPRDRTAPGPERRSEEVGYILL